MDHASLFLVAAAGAVVGTVAVIALVAAIVWIALF